MPDASAPVVRGTRLTIQVPPDYVLRRDACSYGYFLLRPSRWDPATQTLERALDLHDAATTVRITQPPTARERPGQTRKAGPPPDAPPAGTPLTTRFDRTLSPAERAEARRQIARMLRLDETAEHVHAFHRADPRWRASGRARLSRTPSLFEDVIKTVTSCNVAWTSTIRMNERLCAVLGRKTPAGPPAFPSAARLARTRPGTLRGRCGVGYRDQRIIDLATLFAKGRIDEAWLADPATPDAEAFRFLKSLPGIGPYAAGNIMQLLGRYSFLALDTESVRHGRAVLGYEGTDREILRHLEAHYAPFAEHKFKSYWLELWTFYEAKRGPSWTWERETTGKTFTASQLKAEPAPPARSWKITR